MDLTNETREKTQFIFPEKELITSERVYQIAEESYPNGSPWSVTNFQTDLDTSLAGYGFAVKDEKAIGFIGYRHFLGEAEITNFGVNQLFKQQGIGSRLMAACLSHLDEQGMKQLFLEVRASNQSARTVYQKFGLKEVAIRKNYYRDPNEDAVVMQYIKPEEE